MNVDFGEDDNRFDFGKIWLNKQLDFGLKMKSC